MPRKHTVVCKANKSLVLFLPLVQFHDRVLNDPQTERDILFDNIVHNLFFETRQKQKERTLWNARHGQDRNFATEGTFSVEEAAKPKLQSASSYIQQKINTEYYNLIQAGLLERESINLQQSTAEQLQELDQKNSKMIEYFNKDMMLGLPHTFFEQNTSFLESSF